MLKKLMILVACVSLCLCGVMGCEDKKPANQVKDDITEGAKDVEKAADKAADTVDETAKDAGKVLEDATK